MTSRLNPYIQFDGTAEEALAFYQQVFGGELDLNRFGDYGVTEEPIAGKIMHGQLETPSGFTLMAADAAPGMQLKPAGNITISLSGDDAGDLSRWFDGLAEGGTVLMPLEKQMWGDVYGMVTDKFGVDWMANIAGDAIGGSA